MPAPSVSGRILLPQRGQPAAVDVDDRPDLHPHVVHVQLGARGAARDRAPGGSPRGSSPPRARRAAAPVTAPSSSRTIGELAHLRQRHQPPVGRVLPRDALVEQHVLGRLDPGDVEVAQPPQVEPAADHRVHAADQVVLGDAALVGRPEREVADRPAAAGADGDRHPAGLLRERQRLRPAGAAARWSRRRTRGPPASAGRGRPRPRRRYAARRGGVCTERRPGSRPGRPARPSCRPSRPPGWAGRRACSRRRRRAGRSRSCCRSCRSNSR